MSIKQGGTTGPDMHDVLTMWAGVERDLRLRVTLQASPRRASGEVNGLLLLLRVEPRQETGTPWENWHPLDITREWSPRGGRTWPAECWFALWELYSFDFPQEWPRRQVVQLPLP
jgi:hypothetical protein